MNIVLVEPEIPPNTGNVARLCAATGATLHLVGPLGFRLTDKELKRAGMDYWEQVTWKYWESWGEFRKAQQPIADSQWPTADSQSPMPNAQSPMPSVYYVTTKSRRPYTDVSYRWGDYLVFGRETAGLPQALLEANPDRTITIPMLNPQARSLNLATAVAVVLFHAIHVTRGWSGAHHLRRTVE